MRTVTWNMAAGYGYDPERHERAWHYLRDELRPDIALLQEVVIPPWATEVWPSVVAAPKYPDLGGVAWGSAIVSCLPLEDYEHHELAPWTEKLWGSVVLARIAGPDGLWLGSIHSHHDPVDPAWFVPPLGPPKRRCSDEGLWQIEVLTDELEGLFAGCRFVFGGDLNSGLGLDAHWNYDASANLFANLAEVGFVDLRPRFQKEEQPTYFRNGERFYQADHIYADKMTEQVVTDWHVLPKVVTDLDLSDHAPIVVEVDAKGLSVGSTR